MLLDIDLVSDFVCPWCFIGRQRLRAAVGLLREAGTPVATELHWLPFFLNPDTPAEGEPYRAFIEAKFGGPTAVEAMQAEVSRAAAGEGLTIDFARIEVRPNTLKAHRLAYRAQSSGWQPERVERLVDALFAAHFQQGRNIGDTETLADIAQGCGERRPAMLDYLASDRDVTAVRRMADGLRRQGVTGVPFFIIGRSLGVSGAQPASALGAAMLQVLREKGEAAAAVH